MAGLPRRKTEVKAPRSVRTAENFGRVRLSPSFYMRDFLHSEIGDVHGISNLPDDPDLAIMAGKLLCEHLLEPLQATFGRIAVRSAYRSSAVNALGNAQELRLERTQRRPPYLGPSRPLWIYRRDGFDRRAVVCRPLCRWRLMASDGVVDPRPPAV